MWVSLASGREGGGLGGEPLAKHQLLLQKNLPPTFCHSILARSFDRFFQGFISHCLYLELKQVSIIGSLRSQVEVEE